MNNLDKFNPLADDSRAVSIGDLEIENDVDSLKLRGSLDLRPNAAGVEAARSLANLLMRAAEALELRCQNGEKNSDITPSAEDRFGLPE